MLDDFLSLDFFHVLRKNAIDLFNRVKLESKDLQREFRILILHLLIPGGKIEKNARILWRSTRKTILLLCFSPVHCFWKKINCSFLWNIQINLLVHCFFGRNLFVLIEQQIDSNVAKEKKKYAVTRRKLSAINIVVYNTFWETCCNSKIQRRNKYADRLMLELSYFV